MLLLLWDAPISDTNIEIKNTASLSVTYLLNFSAVSHNISNYCDVDAFWDMRSAM
jgi:hypothetical protein